MTTLRELLAGFVFATLCAPAPAALAQEHAELSQPPNGNNQKAEVTQWIGLVKVTIAYHSPRVHSPAGADRNGHIWGELVDYGLFDSGLGPSTATPWRAGANESTTIRFSHDVKVEGHDIKAGTYALFLDVEKTGPWVWIFSNHIGWGSFQYESKYDALRVPATPKDAQYTEYLTFGFDERRPDSSVAFLQWESKRIPFTIDVPNVNDLYVAQMRSDLESWAGFNYQNWQNAAQFCVDKKINLNEALIWANKAIESPFRGATSGIRDFSTLSTRAAVLGALGRDAEADATMSEAVRLPGADVFPVHVYAVSLLAAGRKDKAMELFKFNRQQHPTEPFWTYLGMARGYTAIGDTANAISNWETALLSVPPSQRGNIAAFQRALTTLKDQK